jgi:hypothetical protein
MEGFNLSFETVKENQPNIVCAGLWAKAIKKGAAAMIKFHGRKRFAGHEQG